jgi:hypothetical protein
VTDMLLWDFEMRGLRDELDRMPPLNRLRVAAQAIEWTLGTFDPPFEQQFDERAVRFIVAAWGQVEAALRAGRAAPEAPSGYEDEVRYAYDQAASIWGGNQIVMATLGCFDLAASGMSTGQLLQLLSDCYESVLDRQDIAVVTPEAERENLACVRAIEIQQELIRSQRPG